MNVNQIFDDMKESSDSLWLAFDNSSLFSLHVGPEPEFSQDEGIMQINAERLHEIIMSLQIP